MSITAKLALRQLKVNRSRTTGALTAIALATALITAVCSFIASGNEMLVRFLGPDYGEYGGAYDDEIDKDDVLEKDTPQK